MNWRIFYSHDTVIGVPEGGGGAVGAADPPQKDLFKSIWKKTFVYNSSFQNYVCSKIVSQRTKLCSMLENVKNLGKICRKHRFCF